MTIGDMLFSHEDPISRTDPVTALKEEWGQAIKAQRDEIDKSQKWLAQQVGVDQSSVSQWERGVKTPSISNQLKIARALGVAPRVLFQFPATAA